MLNPFNITDALRASADLYDPNTYRLQCDLGQWCGLRPLGLHVAILMRRVGCDPAIVEEVALEALQSARPGALT